MKKYLSISLLFTALLGVITFAQAKPWAPINIKYDSIKAVRIDESISHEISVSSNIELSTITIEFLVKSGLTIDESSQKQIFSDINAGDTTSVLVNATFNNTIAYLIVNVSATDVNGEIHVKNKVIKYGVGSVKTEKLTTITTANNEELILMPAQVQP